MQACYPSFPLRQAHRVHTFQAAIHERQIARAITLLHWAGVDPLAKGWGVARLDSEPDLLSYWDIDPWARPVC